LDEAPLYFHIGKVSPHSLNNAIAMSFHSGIEARYGDSSLLIRVAYTRRGMKDGAHTFADGSYSARVNVVAVTVGMVGMSCPS